MEISLLFLINYGSASSEIVAGALKDHKRANYSLEKIKYGKDLCNLLFLKIRAQLDLIVFKYYLP